MLENNRSKLKVYAFNTSKLSIKMFYLPNRIAKRDLIILFNKNIVRTEGGIIAMTIENNATCPESFGVINIIVVKIEILITNR